MKRNRWKKGIVIFTILVNTVMPVRAAEYWPQEPNVESPCAIVMEMNTGAILYDKNADEVHYPASITKIMTTLVALEECDLEDTVTFSADAVFKNEGDTSHIARELEEKMTLEQCLYGVMLESANECAYAVAEHIGGGDVNKFIDLMNKKAKELGCTNTHFNNPNGLPDEKHYTSSRDMALISRAAYQNETFRIITGTGRYVIPPTNKHEEETPLQNHQLMLYPRTTAQYLYKGCTGGKTGYTDAAKNTLVTFAERDGMSLVCVVMYVDSPFQFTDTAALFDYCFDNFQIFNVKDNEKEFTEDKIQDTGILNTDQAFVGLDKNGGIILPKTASFKDAKAEVSSKNKSETSAGRIEYSYAGHKIGGADIVVTENEPEQFPFDNTKKKSEDGKKKIYINGNILVLLLVLVLIIICVILGMSGKFLSNHYFSLKRFVGRKSEKLNPQYSIIREQKRKWRFWRR